MGIVVETGQATNTGNWSDPTNNQTQSLQNRERTNRYPTGGYFRVTAAPVGLPTAGVNWHGTGDIDLYIVAARNNLQIAFQDPG
jgi:hypothetical protein